MGGEVARARGRGNRAFKAGLAAYGDPFLATPQPWVKRMSESLFKLWHKVNELEEKLNLVIACIQYPHLREQILERLNASIDKEG